MPRSLEVVLQYKIIYDLIRDYFWMNLYVCIYKYTQGDLKVKWNRINKLLLLPFK